VKRVMKFFVPRNYLFFLELIRLSFLYFIYFFYYLMNRKTFIHGLSKNMIQSLESSLKNTLFDYIRHLDCYCYMTLPPGAAHSPKTTELIHQIQ
jgi:hypothetical protein